MPGTFRFVPGCGCCSVECAVSLGPFCACCGPVFSGTVRVWNNAGFDKTFAIVKGYATVALPGTGTYHVQLTGPYPLRTLADFTVTQVYDAVSGKWTCRLSRQVSAYAPADRPATLTLTTPDGTAVTLTHCQNGTAICDQFQYATYIGSTTVRLTHGCWCGTAPTITLPVVFQWRYTFYGFPCGLDVWVPTCNNVWTPNGNGVVFMLCGFPVTAPAACVIPDGVVIPTPPSGDPMHPTSPCWWVKLNIFDTLLYSQDTTCGPLYWRSGQILPFTKAYGRCQGPSASSFVWPGGGYLTVTE